MSENRIINYRKSQYPSTKTCALCAHYLHIPYGTGIEGNVNEGDYCFEGVIELHDADQLDENCIHRYMCNMFEPSPEGEQEAAYYKKIDKADATLDALKHDGCVR